ncbi:MAG: nicotinate-nucleotide adenylyltransferase, partial [Acidobacteria bacterium]|nr:nicotinate-nucleotide adenylyltransferase [Acidobacteriota bacterium]
WTYTIDTLESLDDAEDVVLIVGADTAVGLPSWYRAEDVMDRVALAVIPRPGVTREDVARILGEHHWLDVPELQVSGTMLRHRVRRGASIRFFVPEMVYDYVNRHRLYD